MKVLLKKISNKLIYMIRKPKPVFLLEMIWPKSNSQDSLDFKLNDQYLLRNFNWAKDMDRYNQLLLDTEMGECPIDYWKQHILPGGFFIVEHKRTKNIVGACFASHHPSKRHPFAGNLGWLAVDPGHRGNKIGQVLVGAVVKRILVGGYQNIYLETHDFRAPAIFLYFKMGWIPYLYNDEMKPRWKSICDSLKVAYNPNSWPKNQ